MNQADVFNSMITDTELRVSPNAAAQLANILRDAEGGITGIRVFVSGGGCSGMTYGMTYAESIDARDKVLDGEGFKVVVDAVAMSYLKGCDIDYIEDGMNASFVFNNVFRSGGGGACGGCGSGGGGGGGCG